MGVNGKPIGARNHSAPFQGREVEDAFSMDRAPGDWKLQDSAALRGGATILFVCPCGCDSLARLRLTIPGAGADPAAAPGAGPSWQWNGDRGRPTLAPSIRDLGGCRFHGHLTAGRWTFEPDSGAGAQR
jgi:hypothetical protein